MKPVTALAPDPHAGVPPIAVVGSVNTDLVLRCTRLPLPGETVHGEGFATATGGKGANQAVAAARLGAQVLLVGCIGDDDFGLQARRALRAEGIAVDHLHVASGCRTGVAMVQVDRSGQNSIALDPGANARLSVPMIDAAAHAIGTAGLLICQLETPLASVQRAVDVAHAAGVPVLLNPAPAPLEPLPAALLRRVDVLVANESEAALLSGVATPGLAGAHEAALHLLRAGCGTVVVTLGGDGLVVANAGGSGSRHHPAHRVAVVDTTGAGDAFVGALAAARVDGLDFDRAIAFAQRVAAYSVQRPGAQAAMPTRAQLAAADAGADHFDKET